MKKILLLIIFLGISFPSYSYATGNCGINDETAQVLLDYIDNNRIIINNISKTITSNRRQIKNNNNGNSINTLNDNTNIVEKITETQGLFNKVFSFPSYFSYAEYFTSFPIFYEIPYPVKRDYNLLKSENDGLTNYFKLTIQRGYDELIVENPCEGIGGYCDYEASSIGTLLANLIDNNEKILDLYRLSIMGEEINYQDGDIKLVDNTFILEIKNNYSTQTIEECSSEEGGFFDRIKTSISNITEYNKWGQDGIQKWKDAWAMLIGGDANREAENERRILKEYLDEEGISYENQEAILSNLDKYNLEGLSLNNNFIANTFSLIKSNINDEIKAFKNEYIDKSFNFEDKEHASIEQIKKLENNSIITKQIQEEITVMYQDELPFAAIGDIDTQQLRAKIIEVHASLERSIRTLDELIPRSQNICNSQGGGGNCN